MVWSLDPALVRAAAARLAPLAQVTPLRRSAWLSALAGGDVYLKDETSQTGGSFKIRGAINAIATLSAAERTAGIVASSAGNHGTGIALAAKAAGVRATVFTPRDAPEVKKAKMRAAGVDLRDEGDEGDDYDDAERRAIAFASSTGRRFVSPCSGVSLYAGQGTVALEMMQQQPSLETVIVCVGGGGLLGGVGGWLRAEHPSVRIIGAQSDQTNAMAASLAAGRRVDVPVPPTIADGLAGQIDDAAFAIGQACLDAMVLVTEQDIADAIRLLWREEGLRVEGAGAVATTAVASGKAGALRFPVGITVSGGNIDSARHAAIVGD